MPRPPQPRHFRAKDACFFDHPELGPVNLSANAVYPADDPVVRARPDLFTPLEADRQRPPVEQATAAPGEVRGG
jgi:hypothetical protein